MYYPILLRKEAIARGLAKYFTGVPCKHGHLEQRYTVTSACVSCLRGYRGRIQQRVNTNKMALQLNYVQCSVKVHPQDVDAVNDFAEIVNNARTSGSYEIIKAIGEYVRAVKKAEEMG